MYKSNLPYPDIKVEKENIEYAKLLMYPYASMISEDTATHLYMYQSFILDNNIGRILENIAIVEMHHLEMLAKTINLLGLKPEYKSNDIPWTSNYVNYNTNLKDILKINIEAETLAIKNYQNLIKVINDKYIKKMLERIIVDEEIHLKIFNDLYKENR
ncbi:MAG TPA: manganese catalase family protein [Candidatus Faecisoma merdavium]|nr:manganese catalase family protein [Candidatus Faecisoma merdavium]